MKYRMDGMLTRELRFFKELPDLEALSHYLIIELSN
jgi:hypothetical protein